MQARRLQVIFADNESSRNHVKHLLKQEPSQRNKIDVLWVSQVADDSTHYQILPHKKAQTILGSEFSLVIYDAHDGFFPDTFAAIAGTIRSGGTLLLLLSNTPNLESRFMQRFLRIIHADSSIDTITLPSSIKKHAASSQIKPVKQHLIKTTDDQLNAIEAIKKVISGHRRRPLVITSDRGRGKSAALGLSAKQLILQGLQNILVTAPSKKSAEMIFKHADNIAGLHFISPDDLVKKHPKTGLLLIDEAAAIPAPLLSQLLTHYSRIVFSTTQHGYEGTGRGFDIRFKQELNRQTPDWKSLTLKTPMRWAEDDPLEKFVFKTLLLDANQSKVQSVNKPKIRKISQDELLKNDTLLSQIFGLLVTAHYQTKPSDLQFMLDDENVSIHIVEQDNQVIATALSITEGGFDATLAQEIYAGKRRPKGHLIPQSLAFHAGVKQAAMLIGERIIRIAVHKNCQRKGLATQLIQAIYRQSEGKDYIGVSVSATSDMLHFWDIMGFTPMRLGLKRDASSGTHSVIQLLTISAQGKRIFQQLRERFLQSFLHMLSEPLRELEANIVVPLLQHKRAQTIVLKDWEWEELHAFATTHRGYEVCISSLWNWLKQSVQHVDFNKLKKEEQAILIGKILQKKPWGILAKEIKLTGKKDAIRLLRKSVFWSLQKFDQ